MAALEMTAPDADVVCPMGNLRYAFTGRVPIVSQDEFVTRAIRVINRIPIDGADAKTGTPERKDFVDKTILRALSCVSFLFHPQWDNAPVEDPDLANSITLKEWRLAAKIEAETNRKYTAIQ